MVSCVVVTFDEFVFSSHNAHCSPPVPSGALLSVVWGCSRERRRAGGPVLQHLPGAKGLGSGWGRRGRQDVPKVTAGARPGLQHPHHAPASRAIPRHITSAWGCQRAPWEGRREVGAGSTFCGVGARHPRTPRPGPASRRPARPVARLLPQFPAAGGKGGAGPAPRARVGGARGARGPGGGGGLRDEDKAAAPPRSAAQWNEWAINSGQWAARVAALKSRGAPRGPLFACVARGAADPAHRAPVRGRGPRAGRGASSCRGGAGRRAPSPADPGDVAPRVSPQPPCPSPIATTRSSCASRPRMSSPTSAATTTTWPRC